jgi:DNA modification methylase
MANQRTETFKDPVTFGRWRLCAVTDLTPDPRNPRKHSPAQVQGIARSIEAFGFNAPVLIDKNGQIVAGHGRYKAAVLLGLEQIPVVSLEHLNKERALAYMLADNRLAARSSWNDEALALQLKELTELALDFDIEAIGFEPPEIDLRIQSLNGPSDEDAADDFEISAGPVVSKLGDLWILGSHRLFCANPLDLVAYNTVCAGEKVVAAVADPLNNVRFNDYASAKGEEFAVAVSEMAEVEFTSFLNQVFGNLGAHCCDGALIYGFMAWQHMAELLAAAHDAGLDVLNLCVWSKSGGGMGTLYRSRHELIFVFKNGQTPHLQLDPVRRNRSNVWNYPGINSVSRKKGRPRLDRTAKPIALLADAILDCTRRDDIVLDPFVGSGTTILAAEQTGRRCYGIELDPRYVDTAIERWQRFTGGKAHNGEGRTFDQIATERGACQ